MTNRLLAFGLGILLAAGSTDAQTTTKGNASYYSDKLHGRRTSNGDKYHRDSMTCAHLKYPLGTLLKVRNPKNDREVIVKVTDRGPHTRRFVIDLSRAAARKLDIIQAGFSLVEITPYHPGIVPYRLKPDNETPELGLEYLPCATFPVPIWQQDSTFKYRIRLPHPIARPRKDSIRHTAPTAPSTTNGFKKKRPGKTKRP